MAKILVVDDDPDFVEATQIVLEREGHTIVSAAGGGEALDKIAKDTPDLIILDVIMDTVLDGLSVAQELGGHPDYRDIPIIMITSIANTDYAELFPTDEYVHLDTFLTKPVAPERMVEEVNRLL
ncbi:MAG: response regulator [Anaerolineales bacterium]|nr:response regulator [Anaerolineales bacterium]